MRLTNIRNKLNEYRQKKMRATRNKSEMDTIVYRAENEKLQAEAQQLKIEQAARTANTKLKAEIKSAKKARFQSKIQPFKTAAARAGAIVAKGRAAQLKAAKNPMFQSTGTSPLLGMSTPTKSAKRKVKRIKTIEYE